MVQVFTDELTGQVEMQSYSSNRNEASVLIVDGLITGQQSVFFTSARTLPPLA